MWIMTEHHHSHHTGQRMALSLVITLAFVGVEASAGWFANSLALLSDAGHNLTDVIALGLAWYAIRLGSRPSSERRTYGYHRAGILAALVNSFTLGLIAVWIFYEAYQRFQSPLEVQSGILIGVGLLAVVVNLGTAWLIHQDSDHDLNVRSAFVHLMGDVFSTIGATIAGVVILFTGWVWLDALVSALIGGLIFWNALGILRETLDILLESTPRDIDMKQMLSDMALIEGVQSVHDVHVWSINQEMRSLSAHVVAHNILLSDTARIQAELSGLLRQRYHIAHATLQLECVECQPNVVYCDLTLHSSSEGR